MQIIYVCTGIVSMKQVHNARPYIICTYSNNIIMSLRHVRAVSRLTNVVITNSPLYLLCVVVNSIQSVDTSENGLLSLPPPYAWKSRGLREIKMMGNKVSKLDFSDCGRFWPKLESLYLGQNKIKEVM